MSSVNILFYSNNCDGSKHLISLMQNENLLRFFHSICTDNNDKIPPQIKVTPTLVIRGVPTPYVAADAFGWFAKVKQWKINKMMHKMTMAQQQYLQNINSNLVANNDNVLGFNPAEMAGMSDIFSFFSKDMEKECQEPMPQSFVNYQNIGEEKIFAPPKEDDKYKINAAKQKELHNRLQIDRKKQDELFKQNMDNFRNNLTNQKN